jgi:benzoyl-CoA reductase/2-hydroxyglutaryl-CoA dehydratase subunit BcrC/BadD/HgdB
MTALEIMQKYYEQRDLAGREWKEKGGKVVGYFCDIVPEELISASGFLPYRLSGDPLGGMEAVDVLLFRPGGPPEGFVHSIFNMLLTSKYDYLDFLIIPNTRASIQKLYFILVNLKASNPSLKLPEIYFFDNLHTTFYISGLYVRERIFELKKKLEEWSGKSISDESLSKAITISNENRILQKKVAALRTAEPPRILGVEALQIIGSSMFMSKEDHNRLLKKFLGEENKLPARNGARLFVEGSPLDNLQLYKIIESSGAIVVAEDNCWGNRYSDKLVNTSANPLEAIVDRYLNKTPCPQMLPMSRRVDNCLNSALDAKAQGVIFNVLERDNSLNWEIPDEKAAFEQRKIPSLFLKDQKYLISESKRLTDSIEEFVKTMKIK